MSSNIKPDKTLSSKRFLRRFQIEPVVFTILNYTFLVLLCALMLYPMLNTLAVSFNDALDAIRGGIRIWPREFTTHNYRVVFNMHTIYTAFFNSFNRTWISVILNLAFTSMLAFALSRQEFIFRKVITVIFVLTMYFDPGLIPGFLLIQSLGLLNSFHVYWVPGLISAFNLIIMRTYIKGIPESLIESARLDGAGDFRIYLQIILPLCKPVLATIALFVAVGSWNAWFDNFLFNSASPHLNVLQFELQRLLSSAMATGAAAGNQATQQAQATAGLSVVTPQVLRATITIVTAIPILVVYPFLQRYFVAGVKLGGVKE